MLGDSVIMFGEANPAHGMEAMPGGGRLTIVTRVVGERVECAVGDSGVGMTPEVQAEMFRPFFSTKPAGTGLGMPFVRQVTTEHGGTLNVQSTVGTGTTFTITLSAVNLNEEQTV